MYLAKYYSLHFKILCIMDDMSTKDVYLKKEFSISINISLHKVKISLSGMIGKQISTSGVFSF